MLLNAALLAAACLSAPVALVSGAATPAPAIIMNKAGHGAQLSADVFPSVISAATPKLAAFRAAVDSGETQAADDDDTTVELVTCKKNAECKAIDKNGFCGDDGTCRCKDGYAWDTDKEKCQKLTEAYCNAHCSKLDPNAVCTDVAELGCGCDVGYLVNDDKSGCREATQDECDAECADLFGKNSVCLPWDWNRCGEPVVTENN